MGSLVTSSRDDEAAVRRRECIEVGSGVDIGVKPVREDLVELGGVPTDRIARIGPSRFDNLDSGLGCREQTDRRARRCAW